MDVLSVRERIPMDKKRMGYTEEKVRGIRYKMALYDDFLEEFNYRKKHYGVREASRMVEVHEKNRGTRC